MIMYLMRKQQVKKRDTTKEVSGTVLVGIGAGMPELAMREGLTVRGDSPELRVFNTYG
jgi:hypothetical protein